MNDNMRIEPGQIWEVDTANGRIGKVVVIAVQAGFANTLDIWDGDNPSNYQLSIGGSVDTRRSKTTQFNNFRCLIDFTGEDEFAQIRERVAYAFGFTQPGDNKQRLSPEEELRVVKAERDTLKFLVNKIFK